MSRSGSDIRLLDRKVVHITTWVASAFAVGLLLTGAFSRDGQAFAFAITPAGVAIVGWVMVAQDRYSVAAQLFVGMAGLAISLGVFGAGDAQAPLLGFLAMGIAAALFVRSHVRSFVVATTVGMAVAGFLQMPEAPLADRFQSVMSATGSYLFIAWLVLWMKSHWLQSQARLHHLIRSKDQLVASVSHELRTPMTSVVGLAHELDDRFDEFEYAEVRELIGLLVHESTDVANILEDLLVAARADVGTLSLESQPVEIYTEINWALTTVSAATLERHHRTEPLYVLADPGRVRQILRNLVVNANRYGGPAIRVVVGRRGDEVAVAVCDDGDPIDAADRARIFEPYQGVNGSLGVPGSVGLGLTVSRQLARLMGGDLVYGHDGSETVFTLTLPGAVSPASAEAQAADMSAARRPSKL